MLLSAYYSELNALPAFRRALAALWIGLRPTRDAEINPLPEADAALDRFVEHWGLPRSQGVCDLWHSLRQRAHTRWRRARYESVPGGTRLRLSPWLPAIWTETRTSPLPPHHKSPENLARVARRLVRRAVQRWSWRRIVEAEAREENVKADLVDMRAVRKSTETWGRKLGIRLPSVQRGRPKTA
ncbi:MAG: hypothetical protein HY721_17035 [Planctomycetes bacterium]|nr:hypothetical protein [Planctomycetota bacterium]